MCRPTPDPPKELTMRKRRGKREKNGTYVPPPSPEQIAVKKKRRSLALEKHSSDAPSGGLQSLLPSIIGLAVLGIMVMAKMGFRGRATVAGIDLGTTNSVICVQKPAKGVGEIECIPDASTGSPIVPSVVSFLEASDRPMGPSSKVPSLIIPHPTHVVVGQKAKRRIDSHPHHTIYNAKRVIGRPFSDAAISELQTEVEFAIQETEEQVASFRVPDTERSIPPFQVGAYIVDHLMKMTNLYLGHENVKSAVICVPAKFDDYQRQETFQAFRHAGISVARVVEEPTAAALAYGLHKKEGVDYIMVYDFGGGTLDISLLYVSEGFVDVMGSDGDDRLGGADFDAAIAHFLLEHRGGNTVVEKVNTAIHHFTKELQEGVDFEQELSHKCPILAKTPLCTTSSFHTIGEQLKIALSSKFNSTDKVQSECLGPSPRLELEKCSLDAFCSYLEPVKLTLTLEEYDEMAQHLYDRSILPVHRLLKDLDLTSKDINEVVMVGGTTRMPQIRNLVRQALPTAQLNTHIDPDITVAYGAASVID